MEKQVYTQKCKLELGKAVCYSKWPAGKLLSYYCQPVSLKNSQISGCWIRGLVPYNSKLNIVDSHYIHFNGLDLYKSKKKKSVFSFFLYSFYLPICVERSITVFACVQATPFWHKFNLQNWGAAYARNIMSFWRLSLRHWYCMLWNSQWRPLVFETVILQAIAQRITGVSPYFYYMRVANTIDSRSQKTMISLTNHRKCF
jgi:hypothetical protein